LPHSTRSPPQLIVNAAAYTAVDQAETDETTAQAVNAEAPGLMAEQAKKIGAALVHYSTDFVFDGTKNYRTTRQIPQINQRLRED